MAEFFKSIGREIDALKMHGAAAAKIPKTPDEEYQVRQFHRHWRHPDVACLYGCDLCSVTVMPVTLVSMNLTMLR